MCQLPLEADRGTETLSNPSKGFYKMIRFYLGYASSGKYKGYAEDFHCDEFKGFRVLVITTSPKRMENMRRAMVTTEP